jgi:hypothetical protein
VRHICASIHLSIFGEATHCKLLQTAVCACVLCRMESEWAPLLFALKMIMMESLRVDEDIHTHHICHSEIQHQRTATESEAKGGQSYPERLQDTRESGTMHAGSEEKKGGGDDVEVVLALPTSLARPLHRSRVHGERAMSDAKLHAGAAEKEAECDDDKVGRSDARSAAADASCQRRGGRGGEDDVVVVSATPPRATPRGAVMGEEDDAEHEDGEEGGGLRAVLRMLREIKDEQARERRERSQDREVLRQLCGQVQKMAAVLERRSGTLTNDAMAHPHDMSPGPASREGGGGRMSVQRKGYTSRDVIRMLGEMKNGRGTRESGADRSWQDQDGYSV